MKLLKSGPRSWLERQIGDRASLRWSSEGVPLLDKSETGQPILLKIAALGHQELAADPSTDVRVEAAFYSTNQIEQIEQIGQPEAR
jgi:hypothetical protein